MRVYIGPFPDDCSDPVREIEIHKYDTWSMDNTLSHIILPMLKQLKESQHGAPSGMPSFKYTSNQAQKSFDFYKEGDDLSSETGFKEWEEIMDKMIWSFQMEVDDVQPMELYCIKRDPRSFEEQLGEPDEEGNREWRSTSDYDWGAVRAWEKRKQEGFDLFGKYYQNLWD